MLSDIGSERAVLAGMCQFGATGLVEVDDIISTNTFTNTSNQNLYVVIKKSIENNNFGTIDIPSILSVANDSGLYASIAKDKDDIEYIKSLFIYPIKIENLRGFAKKIAKLEFARNAQAKHKEAYEQLNKITGSESFDEIVGISENPIFEMVIEANRGKDDSPILLSTLAEDLINQLIENQSDNIGVPTPWPLYNASIGGGCRPGGVNLIGARPKRGKSTLCKEMSIHTSVKLNIPTLILDTEMNPNDQLIRSFSSISRVPIKKIETGKFYSNHIEKNKVLRAVDEVKINQNLFYKSIAGKPFAEVMAIIRRWIVRTVGYNDNGHVNPCIVIYDYFKLMNQGDLGDLKEYEAMGYQISNFTDFAKLYEFPVLAFVQLNREEDISQSDRLRWLCHSYSAFLDKTPEQLVDDGITNGNRTMTVLDARYGPGLSNGDYINYLIEGDISTIKEIGLKSKIQTQQQQNSNTFDDKSNDDTVDDNESETV